MVLTVWYMNAVYSAVVTILTNVNELKSVSAVSWESVAQRAVKAADKLMCNEQTNWVKWDRVCRLLIIIFELISGEESPAYIN